MLPLRARAMAMERYTAFPKTPALHQLRHQIVQCPIKDTRWTAEKQSVYSAAKSVLRFIVLKYPNLELFEEFLDLVLIL